MQLAIFLNCKYNDIRKGLRIGKLGFNAEVELSGTDCHVAAFRRLLAMTQKTTIRTKIGAECKKALSLRGPAGAVAIRSPCIRRMLSAQRGDKFLVTTAR